MNNKIRMVMAHEIYTLLSRPSFWLLLFGLPLVSLLILGGPSLFRAITGAPSEDVPFPIMGDVTDSVQEEFDSLSGSADEYFAYLDEGELVREFPPGFDEEPWVKVDTREYGLDLLRGNAVDKLFVIPADYPRSMRVEVYTRQASALLPLVDFSPMRRAIAYNLLDDKSLWSQLDTPISELEEEVIAPSEEALSQFDSPFRLFIPYGVMTALFLSIAGSATLMLNSVAGEKENRVIEVLINAMRPIELMTGKIIGLGLVGLLQVVVWASSAYGLLALSGQMAIIPMETLPGPAIVVWVVVFFLLGYLLYSAVMAGIGALVPNVREASQITLLVSLPMWIPLLLITVLLDAPSGWLSLALSMFPFTAPMAMILRLTVSHPPLWQPILAAALMAAATVLVMRLSARLFRAQTLMAGQRFTFRAVINALKEK